YGLASVCAKLGDVDGAIAMLRSVVSALPELAEARYNLGVNLSNRYKGSPGLKQKQDVDEAVAQLEFAVRLAPREPTYRLALGQLRADTQHLAEGIEHLTAAAALAHDDPEYAYTLGLALRLKGEQDAAEAQLRAAIARNP